MQVIRELTKITDDLISVETEMPRGYHLLDHPVRTNKANDLPKYNAKFNFLMTTPSKISTFCVFIGQIA